MTARASRSSSLPWVVCASTYALVATAALLGWPPPPGAGYLEDAPGVLLVAGLFTPLGAFLVRRRPDVPLGWVLIVMGLTAALPLMLGQYAARGLLTRPGSLPLPELAGRVALVVDDVVLAPLLVALLATFPTGRLPSPRWRWLAWATAAAALLNGLGAATEPQWLTSYIDAPGEPGGALTSSAFSDACYVVGRPALAVSVLGAIAVIVVRFRRAAGVERQQLKLVIAAFVTLVVAVLWGVSAGAVLPELVAYGPILIAIPLLPVALVFAMLRYRLYDIDRLVSRTVSYAAITAVLTGGYLATVVVLRAVLRPVAGESGVAVAISTLAMAAAFQPVRRRVQQAVDRRFNRDRYDAARTVERFRSQLRDHVELDAVASDLLRAVRETVQPAHVTLWLRTTR